MTVKGKKTRAEILRAYNDLVYEEGIKTVTIKKIAQKVGISVGNLNYYFKKKSDIIDAGLPIIALLFFIKIGLCISFGF